MRNLSPIQIGSAILAGVLVALGWCPFAKAASPTLDEMKLTVRKRFPGVAQLSTAELAAWLSDPKREKPILLDTRPAEEYEVSHLQGAIRIDPSEKAEAILARLPRGRPIVAYCSVGYRSSAVAERLSKAGEKAVYNLEGSIFQWAGEGRVLEANGHPANKVHPYNKKYGAMLDEKLRSPL